MKKFIAIAGLLLANACFAAPQDATVQLPVPGDGVVHPNSTLAVSLKPLAAGVVYDVSCLLDNHAGYNVIMKFSRLADYKQIFSLNGNGMSYGQGELIDKKNDNLLKTRLSASAVDDNLYFQNLDNQADVQVRQCTAVPALGGNKG